MKVYEAIARAIRSGGVDVVFGLMGDSNLFMIDHYVRGEGGRYFSAVHEANAVMMAQGYACRTGGPAVASVTQGPGLTNTVTALIECVRSFAPVVLLTGDTAPSNTLNAQTVEQRPLIEATGAEFVAVSSPDDVVGAVQQALAHAVTRGGPVVVDVPTEFMWNEVADEVPPLPPNARADGLPSEVDLDRAVGIMASARRPIVLAGHGAISQTGRAAVLRLAERLGAPIATTLRGKNLFSADEGSLGVFGTLTTPVGAELITECDCVIALGASLNTWTTARGGLLEGKAVVHIDARPDAVGRHAPVAAGLVGDLVATADTIVEWLDVADTEPVQFRAEAIKRLRDDPGHEVRLGGGALNFGVALDYLERSIPSNRTLVYDGGRFMGEAFKFLAAPEPGAQVLSSAFGAVGLGIGAAIGAAAAAPDDVTVLVTGDGGFMMSGLGELHSAVRHGVKLIVVICNDRGYGAEYDQFKNAGLDPTMSLFEWPSFVDAARGLGCRGVLVERVDDLTQVHDLLADMTLPLVIEIRVEPDAVPEVPH